MSTVITDGKMLIADRRTTFLNSNKFECLNCGSDGPSVIDNTAKICVKIKDDDNDRWFVAGGTVVAVAYAGNSMLSEFMDGVWLAGTDLVDVARTLNAVDLVISNIPIGGGIILVTDGRAYEMFINQANGLMSVTEIIEKDLPFAIGSGSIYFDVYKKTFDLGWVDLLQLSLNYDPHSSTDKCDMLKYSLDAEGIIAIVVTKDMPFPTPIQETLLKAQRKMKLTTSEGANKCQH